MPDPRAWISGPADQLAAGGVDHDDHRDEAFLAQDPPVLQRALGHLADGQAVHVDVAARHLAHHGGLALGQVHHHAVLGDHDVAGRDPGQLGEVGVRPQVPPLAVDGHEVARLDQVQHIQEFARWRVAGHVDQRVALVHHPGAPPGQLVDHPVHGGLVARDQGGGQDDRVALGDPDRVIPGGHPGQRGHRLALRPRADQHDLARRHALRVARVDQEAAADRWHPQVAEVAGHAHVAHHGPADEGHPAAVRGRRVEHLLHPVHVAGEAGHDDPLLGLREHLVQHRGDVPLAGDDARDLGVGGVGHQQVDALGPAPGESAQVGQPAVQRQLVHLEVPGVQHHAGRGGDGHRERVRDGVVDREELKVERAERLAAALGDLRGGRRDPVLGELAADQGEGQPRADQGDVVALPQQVGHGADVVLVRVGEDHGLDVVEPAFERGEVGQDQVHAGLVRFGEQHPAVHDQQAALVLEDGHVPADFAQATEADDAQRAGGKGGGAPSSGCG